MKILVAGGGIGGLATALSLNAVGIRSAVFESTLAIEQRGLGIQLQPFAVRELSALGLGPALATQAAPIERLSFYSSRGQLVWSEARGTAAGFTWPQYGIHRGRLQGLLRERLRVQAPDTEVNLGHCLSEFTQTGSGVGAVFARPDCGSRAIAGDALVGADGLHSAVRKTLYPTQRLRYSGQLMWRNGTRRAPLLDGRTAVIAGHSAQKIVIYPMEPVGPDGLVLMNWLVELAIGNDAPPREEWNRKVPVDNLISHFTDWRFDWLDVPALLREAGTVFEFPKMDRDPVPTWSRGAVTLVGDAAHPISPVGAQGGSQAIVDARCLAFHLSRSGHNVANAFHAYERERLPLMAEIALKNRTMGAEAMLDLVQKRAPQGFDDLEAVLPMRERTRLVEDYRSVTATGSGAPDGPSPYSTM